MSKLTRAATVIATSAAFLLVPALGAHAADQPAASEPGAHEVIAAGSADIDLSDLDCWDWL